MIFKLFRNLIYISFIFCFTSCLDRYAGLTLCKKDTTGDIHYVNNTILLMENDKDLLIMPKGNLKIKAEAKLPLSTKEKIALSVYVDITANPASDIYLNSDFYLYDAEGKIYYPRLQVNSERKNYEKKDSLIILKANTNNYICLFFSPDSLIIFPIKISIGEITFNDRKYILKDICYDDFERKKK